MQFAIKIWLFLCEIKAFVTLQIQSEKPKNFTHLKNIMWNQFPDDLLFKKLISWNFFHIAHSFSSHRSWFIDKNLVKTCLLHIKLSDLTKFLKNALIPVWKNVKVTTTQCGNLIIFPPNVFAKIPSNLRFHYRIIL